MTNEDFYFEFQANWSKWLWQFLQITGAFYGTALVMSYFGGFDKGIYFLVVLLGAAVFAAYKFYQLYVEELSFQTSAKRLEALRQETYKAQQSEGRVKRDLEVAVKTLKNVSAECEALRKDRVVLQQDLSKQKKLTEFTKSENEQLVRSAEDFVKLQKALTAAKSTAEERGDKVRTLISERDNYKRRCEAGLASIERACLQFKELWYKYNATKSPETLREIRKLVPSFQG